MNCESWLLNYLTSNIESQFLLYLKWLLLYSLSLKALSMKQWIMSCDSQQHCHPTFQYIPSFALHALCNKQWIMSHDSGVIPPLILNHNSQFILIILIYISLFPYLPSVRGDESWIMTPESSYLSYWITIPNSFKITPFIFSLPKCPY